jgi:prepilin-type N-terminal cleavage/methylation domain-containing protein
MRSARGFTLIEIALVLVVFGLLLGGILKGQELIQNWRVRDLISQQDGLKAAFYGFFDRYRAYPGDFSSASTTLNCTPACTNGNGNGLVRPAGVDVIDEQIAVWEHLANAGFVHGNYRYAAGDESSASAPGTRYARFPQFITDNVFEGGGTARLNLKTGNGIPSDVLAEADLKIDDGVPTTGSFRASDYGGSSASPPITSSGTCYTGTAWARTPPVSNCGGASLL